MQFHSKERKEASRAKKMKIKPNFGLIQEITGIWEKMRPAEVPEASKKAGVESIMTKARSPIALPVECPMVPHKQCVEVRMLCSRQIGREVHFPRDTSRVKKPTACYPQHRFHGSAHSDQQGLINKLC